jgi:trigger factor
MEERQLETQVKRLPRSQVELTISLSAEEVDAFFDRVYRRLAEGGRIRGFRPGKAPRSIIRSYFGRDTIQATVFAEVLEELLPQALQRHQELRAIGEPVLPDLEEHKPAEGQPLSLPIILTVYPTPEIGDLAGMKLVRPSAEITAEEVAQVLEQLRDSRAEWEEVSRAIAPGDRVSGVLVTIVEGQERGRDEEAQLIAARPEEGQPVSLAAQALGHFPGQTIAVEEQVPADDPDPELAGRTVRYEFTIKRVEEKRLPELNDEFAASVSEYDTLAALQEHLRERLREERERAAQQLLETQALAYLLARCDVVLPEVLVAQAAAAQLEDFEEHLRTLGTSLAELAQGGVVDLESLGARERERATILLETKIILDALAEREGLEAEEQDIEAELQELARKTGGDVNFVRQAYEVQEEVSERINRAARVRRLLRWLIEQAEIEELPAAESEQRARELLQQLEEQRRKRRARYAEQEASEAAAEPAATAAVAAEHGAEAVSSTSAEGLGVPGVAGGSGEELGAAAPPAAPAEELGATAPPAPAEPAGSPAASLQPSGGSGEAGPGAARGGGATPEGGPAPAAEGAAPAPAAPQPPPAPAAGAPQPAPAHPRTQGSSSPAQDVGLGQED